MSGRSVLAKIRIVIPAAAAKPAPPVGPALGQHGLNIMSFCKDFNAKTSDFMADVPIPVVLTAFKGHGTQGKISLKHVYHIAELKQKDKGFAFMPVKSLCLSIMSTAKSMGVEVVR